MKKLSLLIIGLFVGVLAFAHPGKTDANGCHTDKKTGNYHCHNKGTKTTKKKEQTNFENVQLLSVYDGDTFKINLSCDKDALCNSVGVRVKGIDTPEIKSKDKCEKEMAKKAKEFTKSFLEGGPINLKNCSRDKYFRLLCDIEVNKKDLKKEILKTNLAVPYDGGKKQKTNCCAK